MVKTFKKIIFIFFLSCLFVGCTGREEINSIESNIKEEKLQVVTTYSIIYDIVKNIGGDLVEIHSLAPIGSNLHEYDPLPLDVQKTTDADAVFYNGLNLEAGNSWFEKLLQTSGKDGKEAPVFRLSEGVEPMFLTTKGKEGEEDPHAWMDVKNAVKYAENARDAFIKIDPKHKDIYIDNARNYIAQLEFLHQKAIERFREIPEEKRILVTSEGAFKYFSKAYGFDAKYIWEINQENQGTPNQITRIVDIIEEKGSSTFFRNEY